MSQQPPNEYPPQQSQYPQYPQQPPYPPQQQQLPPLPPVAGNTPSRQSWWRRYRAASLGARIGIGAAAIIGACVICTCAGTGGLVVLGSVLPATTPIAGQATSAPAASTTPLPTATATAPLPTATATAAPTSTVPAKKLMVTTATLGGPDSAFYAKYGYEGDNLFDVHGVTFSLNDDTGADGKKHVFEMLVYKSDATTWTQSQAQQVCGSFLPPDATFKSQTTKSNGDIEALYTSPELVNTFAPSSGEYDPDGTVAITYTIRDGGVFQCDLSVYA